MGFEISATHTIFFIAAVVIAAGTVGVLNQSVQKFTGEFSTRSGGLVDELATDIRIINDAGNVPNDPVRIYVLNTGSKSIAPEETIVLLNGQPYTDLAYDVVEEVDEVWRSGQVLEITMNGANLGGGDHRIKVVVERGVGDTIRFAI